MDARLGQATTPRKISLQVLSTNLPARRLYQSAGFNEEGQLRKQVKTGLTYVDLIQMAYWLLALIPKLCSSPIHLENFLLFRV